MATTTNYGWTTPDDTALVKDGAAAIRTLGSSVDTTTKALNPSTTLGDIEYRSSTANTNTRLGIGSTGNVLTVAAGVPSWAAPAAGSLTLSTIASGNLPASSSLSLTGLTGDYYMLRINAVTSDTANSNLIMQFNSNTGSEYTSVSLSTTNADTAYYVDSDKFLFGSTTAISRTNNDNYWIIEIKNSKNNGFHTASWVGRCANASDAGRGIVGSGYFTNATTITSIQIKNQDGYNFNAGTYELIGG